MKGAPEKILERCSTIFIDGQDIQMNECTSDLHPLLNLSSVLNRLAKSVSKVL
jgi:magnesium-transporting ATPase (P-type)